MHVYDVREALHLYIFGPWLWGAGMVMMSITAVLDLKTLTGCIIPMFIKPFTKIVKFMG